MNRPCKSAILCDLFPGETDPPVSNFSSEAPDPLVFISRYFPPNPRPCLGCDPTTVYHSAGCNGVVFSAASQAEADLLARLSATVCKEPASQQYTNNPQTATAQCPGGSVFSYTVPGGYMTTSTDPDPDAWIAAADAAALAYAQQQASSAEQMCCVSTTNLLPHPGWMCLGEDLLSGAINTYAITGLNSAGDWTFVVSSGALPDGVTLEKTGHNTAQITGTPTVPGVYTYTILAYRAALPYITISVSDTLAVFGLTNPDLPNGAVGTAYSDKLLTAGGVDPVTFALVGTLPPGLTLDPDGTISGTPTDPGLDSFEVTITDAAGKVCSQEATIQVTGAGLDWTTLVWAATNVVCGPDGSVPPFAAPVITAIANALSASGNGGTNNCGAADGPSFANRTGSLTYNGPPVAGNLHMIGTLGGTSARFIVQIQQDGNDLLGGTDGIISTFGDNPSGTYDFPFTVIDTLGVPSLIQVLISVSCGAFLGFNGDLTGSGIVT